MNKQIKKDFYDDLPGIVCELLDDIILQYEDEEWFDKAWEEYRQHIFSAHPDDQRMPGYVFNKYIEGDKNNVN